MGVQVILPAYKPFLPLNYLALLDDSSSQGAKNLGSGSFGGNKTQHGKPPFKKRNGGSSAKVSASDTEGEKNRKLVDYAHKKLVAMWNHNGKSRLTFQDFGAEIKPETNGEYGGQRLPKDRKGADYD